MKNSIFPKYIFILLFIILICQTFYYYPKLPDIIGSHYNVAGEAHGWMQKNIFFITIISIFSFLFILLLSLPYFIDKLPLSIVNFPNKYLWFNKSIYEKTKDKIIITLYIFNIGLFLFIIFTNQLTITANLNETNLNIKYFFLGLIIFFIFIIFWAIKIFLNFSKKNYLLCVRDNFFNNENLKKDETLNLLGNLKEKLITNNIKINKKEYSFEDFKDIFLKLK